MVGLYSLKPSFTFTNVAPKLLPPISVPELKFLIVQCKTSHLTYSDELQRMIDTLSIELWQQTSLPMVEYA